MSTPFSFRLFAYLDIYLSILSLGREPIIENHLGMSHGVDTLPPFSTSFIWFSPPLYMPSYSEPGLQCLGNFGDKGGLNKRSETVPFVLLSGSLAYTKVAFGDIRLGLKTGLF